MNRLKSAERPLFRDALTRAIDQTWITETDNGRYLPGASRPA